MSDQQPNNALLAFEREKWEAEQRRLDREFNLKERELAFKQEEARRSWWSNPLVIAILGATIAALGSAFVSWQNNRANQDISSQNNKSNLDLETFKAESARILEIVKTGDPNKAAGNLRFLLDTGLVRDKATVASINNYLEQRKSGEGVSLPVPSGQQQVARGANLTGADLSGRNLTGVDLSFAILASANLSNANLTGADLNAANLGDANLSNARLSNARLSNARLGHTNLRGTLLSRALLRDADLTGADLSGADLSGADLSGAKGLTQAQLDAACGTEVLLPSGLTLKPC